jgi:hypothetical protein
MFESVSIFCFIIVETLNARFIDYWLRQIVQFPIF